MDVVEFNLKHLEEDRKCASLMKHEACSDQVELGKEELGAAISLLTLRYQSVPKTSTPTGLDERKNCIDGDGKNLVGRNHYDFLITPALYPRINREKRKIGRPHACRNILKDLLDEEV